MATYTDHQDNYKRLTYFLRNHNSLKKLVIPGHALKPEAVSAIENLKQLTHLSLKFDDSSYIPFKSLSKLEVLKVSFSNGHILYRATNLLKYPTLTHLILINCTITHQVAAALSELTLKYLHIERAHNTPRDIDRISILNIPKGSHRQAIPASFTTVDLFRNKRHIKLTDCDNVLVENLCRNCNHGQEHLTINGGPSPMCIAFDHLKSSAPASALKSIDLNLKITNQPNYTDFLILLSTINKSPNIHWRISLTIGYLNHTSLQFPTLTQFVKHIIALAKKVTDEYKTVQFIIHHLVPFTRGTYTTILNDQRTQFIDKWVPFELDSFIG